jgi:hypothetical protein
MVMDVLVHLLYHAGEVLPKERIIQSVSAPPATYAFAGFTLLRGGGAPYTRLFRLRGG